MNKHIAKRIGYKRYLYRGFEIQGYDYHAPDKSAVWEAYDYDNPDGSPSGAFGHSYTLRECKRRVDEEVFNEKN